MFLNQDLYQQLMANGVKAILDDRENLNIGNRINDVYVLGTPTMIVLGNKFNDVEHEVEDTKDGQITKVLKEDIIQYFLNKN